MIRVMRRLLFCILAFPAAAENGGVIPVPYAPLLRELSEIIDFEEFPSRLSPGMKQDAPLLFEGAALGERFAGQVAVQDGGYDRLTGQPGAPLALLPGPPGQNLTITHIFILSNQVQGLSAPGFPDRESGGEGAVAILFEQDQRRLGFRVSAEARPDRPQPRGRMQVTFHGRDGTIIDRLDLELEWGRNGYGFARPDDQRDIAGITIELSLIHI